MYQEGTRFEMRYYDGPYDMHRSALMLGIIWHDNGKDQNGPDFEESFDIIDTHHPENNAQGLSRQECEQRIHDIYMDEICR